MLTGMTMLLFGAAIASVAAYLVAVPKERA
jgi:hypothetical protein